MKLWIACVVVGLTLPACGNGGEALPVGKRKGNLAVSPCERLKFTSSEPGKTPSCTSTKLIARTPPSAELLRRQTQYLKRRRELLRGTELRGLSVENRVKRLAEIKRAIIDKGEPK